MTARTRKRQVGLIGYPISYSLSPAMHNTAFTRLGIDAEYHLWETQAEGLEARVMTLRGDEFLGANVTIPHKERVLTLLNEVAPLAARAGAVNTIVNSDGHLRGENTDIAGFLWPLKLGGADLTTWRVTILGAGGAARAVAIGLLDAGVRHLTIINRTRQRALALAAALYDERVEALDLGNRRVGGALASVDLLVNATAAGWRPDEPSPISAALLARLPEHAIVYDLTYRRTPLLVAAEERGLATIDGLPMLVEQGALAFALWTGQQPPRELFWKTVQAAREER